MGRVSGEDKVLGVIIGIWVLAVVANLAFWGIVIWGIVKLVQHFT